MKASGLLELLTILEYHCSLASRKAGQMCFMAARAGPSRPLGRRGQARVDKAGRGGVRGRSVHPDAPGVPSPSRRRWVILPGSVDMSLRMWRTSANRRSPRDHVVREREHREQLAFITPGPKGPSWPPPRDRSSCRRPRSALSRGRRRRPPASCAERASAVRWTWHLPRSCAAAGAAVVRRLVASDCTAAFSHRRWRARGGAGLDVMIGHCLGGLLDALRDRVDVVLGGAERSGVGNSRAAM